MSGQSNLSLSADVAITVKRADGTIERRFVVSDKEMPSEILDIIEQLESKLQKYKLRDIDA